MEKSLTSEDDLLTELILCQVLLQGRDSHNPVYFLQEPNKKVGPILNEITQKCKREIQAK